MTPQVLYARAERAATSARLLLEAGDCEGACNRAYFAMFDAARAALLLSAAPVDAQAARSHGGLIAAFSLHLVKPGRVPIELGRALNRAEELRLVADYRGIGPDEAQATWVVSAAAGFVAAMRSTFPAA